MKQTKHLALSSLLAALAVVIMLLGGMIPVATFCCPVLVGLLMLPVHYECGDRWAIAWYGAVAILCCLLGPDKEAAAIYVALGWYPLMKPKIDSWGLLPRLGAKLLLFNGVTALLYTILLYVVAMPGVRQELGGLGLGMLALLLGMGNVTFFLFDALLPKMLRLYCCRLRPRTWKP